MGKSEQFRYVIVRNKSLTKDLFDELVHMLMQFRKWTTPYYFDKDFNPDTERMWWQSYPRKDLTLINAAYDSVCCDLKKFAKEKSL